MNNQAPLKPADMIRPPFFGEINPADGRRVEFDLKNGVLLTNEVPVDIVFIGDSITHFWELNAYFRSFGLVVNRGIGGDTAHIMAQRFSGDAVQLKPRACVAMIGINNTWCLDEPTPPMTRQQVIEQVYGGHKSILEQAKEAGMKLIFCSVMPVWDHSENGQRRNRLVMEINENLKALCREYGAIYADYHSVLVGEDGVTMAQGFSDDGTHPHVIGYNRMAAVIKPLLEEILG